MKYILKLLFVIALCGKLCAAQQDPYFTADENYKIHTCAWTWLHMHLAIKRLDWRHITDTVDRANVMLLDVAHYLLQAKKYDAFKLETAATIHHPTSISVVKFLQHFRKSAYDWAIADRHQSAVDKISDTDTAIKRMHVIIKDALVPEEITRLTSGGFFCDAYKLAIVLQGIDNTLGTTEINKVIQAAKDRAEELATEAKQLSSQTKLQTAQAIADGFPDPHKTALKQAINAAYVAATQYVPQNVPQDDRERLAMLQRLTARAIVRAARMDPAPAGGGGNVERTEEKD